MKVAYTLGAKAIVVFTSRGTTVQKAAQLRPGVPVMGVTPNIETARGLALTWGVYPCVINPDSEDVSFRMMLFKVMMSLFLWCFLLVWPLTCSALAGSVCLGVFFAVVHSRVFGGRKSIK